MATRLAALTKAWESSQYLGHELFNMVLTLQSVSACGRLENLKTGEQTDPSLWSRALWREQIMESKLTSMALLTMLASTSFDSQPFSQPPKQFESSLPCNNTDWNVLYGIFYIQTLDFPCRFNISIVRQFSKIYSNAA
ncbi:hypothetical protein R6Q59_010010 [Mikania micrantha]